MIMEDSSNSAKLKTSLKLEERAKLTFLTMKGKQKTRTWIQKMMRALRITRKSRMMMM